MPLTNITLKTKQKAFTIWNIDGVLEMTGNCFDNNHVTIAPVINSGFNDDYGYIQKATNNFVRNTVTTTVSNRCDFIANEKYYLKFLTDSPETVVTTCNDHDLDTCTFTY